MVMTSLGTFSGLLEVLIGRRNLARWALYILYIVILILFPQRPGKRDAALNAEV